MPTYYVRWEIELEADNEREAVKLAHEVRQLPEADCYIVANLQDGDDGAHIVYAAKDYLMVPFALDRTLDMQCAYFRSGKYTYKALCHKAHQDTKLVEGEFDMLKYLDAVERQMHTDDPHYSKPLYDRSRVHRRIAEEIKNYIARRVQKKLMGDE